MTRAAIYARYSSDLQSAASIDDQVRLCRERATALGHEVVEVFSDYAISASSLRTRPGMLALMDAARAGSFDVVIAEALDRISRDQEDVAAIYKRLTHAEVKLITLAEGEINELHVGLKGTMNALFLKDLAEKTRRGQRGRVEAGRIPGGNSYGYRMVRRIGTDGDLVRGERELDPNEAKVIRQIFDDYVAGQTPRAIAASLNQQGIPSPRGGLWNASTINGSRQRQNGILNNALYLGRITYNRQRFVKDPDTAKRVSRPNPEHLWITKEVPELRIIDDATWDAAQALRARYSSRAGNKRQTKKRLLSGLVRCAGCGGAMTIINRERYSCSARRERGTCSCPVSISAAELETRILTALEQILLGRDDLIAEFAASFRAEVERQRRSRTDNRPVLQKELEKVSRSIERALAFILEGDGDPGSVRHKLKELEARKRDLERQLSMASPTPTLEIHPNLGELYRRKVQEMNRLLLDEATRLQAMEIIRSLVQRIEVAAGAKRGPASVTLYGALASVLEFALGATNAKATANGGLCRVLMVAGAGFEPAAFRL
ncbi:recombinase family protein [Rhodobacteraceae bacterium HSP-20]|uniref:Recombinase family protein n=1 Tax=Paragemmobacter amnigenus TaxID=2852097 RepID=A0ABS6J8G7_9RHOB|nr:recombinase family protein [Rhodobacter amnigenus]MBU9700028.1 recombinase family protein [Rhodobacter amnigenus]MBV4391255.1 recombinase family protein [Rhodobacter amnigenus]